MANRSSCLDHLSKLSKNLQVFLFRFRSLGTYSFIEFHSFPLLIRNPMNSKARHYFLIVSCSLFVTGCGSPTRNETASQSPMTGTLIASSRSTPNEIQLAPNAALADSSPDAIRSMAEELTTKPGSNEMADSDDNSDAKGVLRNPFDVPEDTSLPSADIRSINKAICKLKYAGKSYDLLHSACYVVNEFDGPTKCVIFSDSPIDVDMLKRELLEEGRPVYRWDLSKKATNMLGFLIREYGVSIDANLGKLSLGIASENIRSTLTYSQGKIAGKIVTTAPIEIGSEGTIEVAAQLNQPVVQVDWAKRNSHRPSP